jgi:hypothetical protein
MGLSLRLLVVDQADCIRRLEVTKFDAMLDNPKSHVFRQFAGQRVRSAEAVVELIERRPSRVPRVVRMTFYILTFDQAGCLDREAFGRQQFSRFASGASTRSGLANDAESESGVLDARYLFADRGGRWVPSETLLRAMHDAVLGNVSLLPR